MSTGRRRMAAVLVLPLLIALFAPQARADVGKATVRKPSAPSSATKGKAKPQQKTVKAKRARLKHVKVPDGRLAEALAWPRVALPPGIFGRASEAPAGVSQTDRARIEASLQEEIAPPADVATSVHPARPALVWPVIGPVRSPFGPRNHRFHAGIDISAPHREPVVAAADGLVLYSGASRGPMGNAIVLQHEDDLLTVYAHLSRVHVKVGHIVRQGDQIGEVGSTGRSTGPHLHFAVRDEGRPINPMSLLPSESVALAPPSLEPPRVQ